MTLQILIQQIDDLKKELDSLRPISVEREAKIKQTFRLWWNYHSNAIEGNQLTLGETISLILFDLTAKGKSYKDHREVKGHNEALLWIEEIVKENRPLTQHFIRELHQTLLKESYDSPAITPTGQIVQKKISIGAYKTSPNHVRTSTGEIYHYALPEEVPAMVDDLLRWYEQEKIKLHPLVLAATFHYRFVKIHPFDDGNGRMSRILMNLILMRGGYPPAIIKMEKRSEYLAALGEADAGDLEKFILFVGECLLESTDLYVRGAKGENIGESDDLDKKIALLKLQLKNQNEIEERPIERNIEVQKELFEKSLKPLIDGLEKKLIQFNDLFLKTNHTLEINTFIDYKENFVRHIKKAFEEKNIEGIRIYFVWEKFNMSKQILFDVKKNINIILFTNHYYLQISNVNIQPIERKYGFQLSQEEIKQIINSTAESILIEIQQKTNIQL
ncbi:MAG: Fic family protein [Chitinophagales bacterium]